MSYSIDRSEPELQESQGSPDETTQGNTAGTLDFYLPRKSRGTTQLPSLMASQQNLTRMGDIPISFQGAERSHFDGAETGCAGTSITADWAT
jgi:hypothetical protein